jgi:flagellar basal-body rod protein FlgG
MANGIYTAAAGMAAQQARLDAIANDLANSSTVGYKTQRVAFRDLVYNVENGVAVGSGVATVDAGRTFATGSFEDSKDPMSLAIDGEGFFQVKRADGSIALTRAGNFQIDSNGSVVMPTGEALVPPIKVPKNTRPQDIAVSSNGTVTVKGKTIGRINIVNVAAPNALLSAGSNMYLPTKASGPATAANVTTLRQGELESSNVDAPTAMTELMDAQQTFSLSSRAMQVQDQLMQIANEIKR